MLVPAQEKIRRLALERRRPIGIGKVDRPAAVRAEGSGENQSRNAGLAAPGGFARLRHEMRKLVIGIGRFQQQLDLLLAGFPGLLPRVRVHAALVALEFGDQILQFLRRDVARRDGTAAAAAAFPTLAS